jgi:hypothetical protein
MITAAIKEGDVALGRLKIDSGEVESVYEGDNPLVSATLENLENELVITNGSSAERGDGMLHSDESDIQTGVGKIEYARGLLNREDARIEILTGEPKEESMAEALATLYDEGDTVDTPDGLGVVSEIRTENFTGPDGDEVEATEDSPAYVVAVEDEDTMAGTYKASDMETTEFPDVDVENPTEALEAWVDIEQATYESLQDGFFSWPESWQDSEQPARLIALKAWAGMGGRHTGCVREMRGNVGRPNAFCADFKDRILGWEGWRQ